MMKFFKIIFFITFYTSLYGQYDEYEEIDPDFYNPEMYTVLRDSMPLKVVEKYLQKDGLILNFIRIWVYDNKGNILEEQNLDTLLNFKPAVICSAPRTKFEYDDYNNLIETSYWNNKKEKGNHDCFHFHKEKKSYNAHHQLIYQAAYLINDKLYVKIKFEYNKKGSIKKVSYLDEQNLLVEGDQSIKYLTYDKNNREIKRVYRTDKNQKIKNLTKTSFIKTEYGENFYTEISYNYKNEVLEKVKFLTKGADISLNDLLIE